MLSKLLQDSDLDVRPIVWRRGSTTPLPEAPLEAAPASDELSLLRGKVSELTACIERRSQESFDAGLRAGEAAARQSLESEVRGTIERLAVAIAEVASLRAETIHRAEADTVRLAVEIARRVLHRELTVDTSALGALIKAALEKLRAQEVYRVRVHPDQAKIVRSCLDEMGRSQAIEVVHDASQQKGGAVFEINGGALDASLETQLREIECGLTDQLEARR
ncbi:MAG: FliH/SctL family protein [Bryobacteraceae bacterium]|jgi:flagellar assembly protein FliH